MSDAPSLPARYESIRRLGAGGGGEVYEVRDRVDGRRLALKALAVAGDGTTQHEIAALVREATTLMDLSSSALMGGMALPRVERFGRLADGRPYLVREMVDGQSLAGFIEGKGAILGAAKALQGAALQLTQLHRAGLLHGDIKPANLIVRPDGTAALVDLGLATKWGPSGATPEGLTPRYAAPELMRGEPLTVRGEVYALGASLRDALAGCAREGLSEKVINDLVAIVARATAQEPTLRHPSVDEVGAAITAACGFPLETRGSRGIWTIVGIEGPLATLVRDVEELKPGGLLEVRGPVGAGGRTLMAALAWRLGISGWPVAWVRGPFVESALVLELATAIGMSDATLDRAIVAFGERRGLLVVEDLVGARAIVTRLREARALVVARVSDDDAASGAEVFSVAPLDAREASELVRRALPSLPEAVSARVALHGEGRPGRLRAIVDAIADRAIVRAESVDVIVASLSSALHGSAQNAAVSDAVTVVSGSRAKKSGASIAHARELLDAGRVTEAEAALSGVRASAQTHLLRGWISLAKGEYAAARSHVDALTREGLDAERDLALLAERDVLLSKVCSRTSNYEQAVREADRALIRVAVEERAPAIAAEALQARGLARIYASDLDGAFADFARSLELCRVAGSKRVEALVHASLAIAHQRTGKPAEARSAYRAAIDAAEEAGDASAVATSRLNLGTLCWHEGDLGNAISEFESAADLGRRVQRQSTVERALINLGFVDLQLGRYARVASTLQSIEPLEAQMTPSNRAQLIGLRADLAGRTGDMPRAVELYRAAIAAWRATGRPQDAAEVTVDEVLMRRQRGSTLVDPREDLRAIDAASAELGSRAAELSVQFGLARGLCKLAAGDEPGALEELDRAATAADEQHANEWRWQVHAARARVLAAQGSHARARRDADEAATILEEIASKLPRDLREVFWDEPRRRSLRQVHEATVMSLGSLAAPFGSARSGVSAHGTIGSAVSGGSGQTQFVRLAEDRLARILSVNRELAGEFDLERLLARVTDQAIDLLGADRGFVLMASGQSADGEEASSKLEPRAARDRGKEDPSIQFSRSIADRVLQTNEAIVTNNAQGDARLGGAASVHALSIQSVACVPIPRVRGGDRGPIGVLYLETRGARAARNPAGMEAELPTLLAFADQVGIALENARLVEENRRRADELARANEALEVARQKLDDALARRTEQLERAKADLASTRQALRGHAGYAGYKGLVGSSQAMRTLYALVDRVRATDIPVLITGESGTGKELVARAVHAGSERSKGPFLGVNCGAIPENLLESELFGSVRGAFTGADRDRKGLFREAERGSILLDEIGEMPLKMQSGLLRVLQEKMIRPVGGTREEKVDARVICATHRSLQAMVDEGTFREDLFYRINVVVLRVPSLRERAEDVPILADHFLGVFAAHYRRDRKSLSRDALKKLQAHAWPGNVRQLEHVLLNAFVMSDASVIEAQDLSLPEATRARLSTESGPKSTPRQVTPPGNLKAHKDTEKDRILRALEKCGWNRLQAAKACGIPRRTFYRRLREYGIQE